jgi:CDP-paratose 2-epimerase
VDFKRICITGGAGFVGSNLAIAIRRRHAGVDVTALDSLKRRGSELTLPLLREHGVAFVHGDIRCPEDLAQLPAFDLLIDCSAEPSVQAGATGSPAYVLHTNLTGSIEVFEAARVRGAAVLFLSTSRVYPLDRLNALAVDESPTRYQWSSSQRVAGISEAGVAEDFALDGVRSFYGASKLASEIVLQEYRHAYGMRVLINRCGVLAGPWQFGKVDQGVVTLWVARHAFGRRINYTGFGGSGKQVRDILHIDDLIELVLKQCAASSAWSGQVYNVGGGSKVSVSLRELTALCEDVTGQRVEAGRIDQTSPMDVRIYLSDARKVSQAYQWAPRRSARDIVGDVYSWIASDRERLAPILG